jgi:hypothetical protein
MNFLFKITFFFSFTLLCIAVNGQNRAYGDEQGIKEANEDWAKNEAKYFIYGLKSFAKNDFEDGLYLEHLGVFLTQKGCFVSGTERGYNMRIIELLKEKLKTEYGRDKLITLKRDVRIFYDSLNKLKTRKALFKGGEKHLSESLNSMAQYWQSDEKSGDLGNNLKITLTFTINKKGKCKHFSLTKTENTEFDNQLFATFKHLFHYWRWLPAKASSRQIEEERALEIVFNPD